MNIIIYNTNSFGGNFEYSKHIALAYSKQPAVQSVVVVVPQNAPDFPFFVKLTLPDISSYQSKFLKRIYFFYRSVQGPLTLYQLLKKSDSSVVICNDYDQLTAFLWAPLFKKLKQKHLFSVILHDPDRDKYLPSKWLSAQTMKAVMSIMDIAFYHEVLPNKPYYKNASLKVNVPHGIYRHEKYDESFLQQLKKRKGNDRYISILGNMRDEKNYEFVIDCLPGLPGTKLLIIGKPSHSNFDTSRYKNKMKALGVEDKVVWIEKFMSDDEFQSAIMVSDVVLLYYKESFTSQSGVLNLIAAHKKPLVVSDVPSALRETVRQFGLGKIVPLNKELFIEAANSMNENNYESGWNDYIAYASWDKHAEIGVKAFASLLCSPELPTTFGAQSD